MGTELLSIAGPATPLVQVRGLTKRYRRGASVGHGVPVSAIDDVSFAIAPGATFALVGQSGSGKSTVARCVAGLEKPDSGQIWIQRDDSADRGFRNSGATNRDRLLRNRVQMVFQDAVTSMNPRFTAAQVVEEPLIIMGLDKPLRRRAAQTVVGEVGLPTEWLDRSIKEFSGGQRQRLAIARALVVRPKLLVLDEALTGLDLSTQAQIANLLLELQAAHALTYLLISHDLALVARVADTIAVMSRGRIVEIRPTSEIMTVPKHEETLRLLAGARLMQANFAAVLGTTA